MVVPREAVTLHPSQNLKFDQSAGAKRANSAIPKLNLKDIEQAPKKQRKNTNIKIGHGQSITLAARREQSLMRPTEATTEMFSNRNLIIPKVVKAIRNIDIKPNVTSRTVNDSPDVLSSSRSKSTDSKPRLSVTISKRMMPMDILTDAKATSGEVILSDR